VTHHELAVSGRDAARLDDLKVIVQDKPLSGIGYSATGILES
jgi:hypothetical protein